MNDELRRARVMDASLEAFASPRELVCNSCGHADRTPDAQPGVACGRIYCDGRLEWRDVHAAGNGLNVCNPNCDDPDRCAAEGCANRF